ncbi:MAG: indole-3-glycerol phosphate synthase TrpC [Pseudomonadales bacterium]
MTENILTRIVAHKRDELAARQAKRPLRQLEEYIAAAPTMDSPRGFAAAIHAKADKQQPAVIAEIKKASPSQGVIREDFDPTAIAKSYADAGATCLSVLTDEKFFMGSDDCLKATRQAVALPLLRKDFVIDAYQVYEARALGADCILLIASLLSQNQLQEYCELAASLGMDALIEVHDQTELTQALAAAPPLIGINNRDLKTFDVDLNTTLALLPQIPAETRVVTESGIHQRADVERMMTQGVYGFLVGEAFMRADDPGAALQKLFG